MTNTQLTHYDYLSLKILWGRIQSRMETSIMATRNDRAGRQETLGWPEN